MFKNYNDVFCVKITRNITRYYRGEKIKEVKTMTELEKYFNEVYSKLYDRKYTIETLELCDPELESKSKSYIDYIIRDGISVDEKTLGKFIQIQLDYYTFSNTGNVFISDSDYDTACSLYKNMGNTIPSTSVFEPSAKTWQVKQHAAPSMVGTVAKVFTKEDVKNFIVSEASNLKGSTIITFAPKFDGVGVCLEYDPEKMDFVSALTRKDGVCGQEIIKVIKKCKNYDELLMPIIAEYGNQQKAFVKCEIVLSQNDFDELSKLCPYKNRRNAVSGLINTPANVPLAKYLTVLPIARGYLNSHKEFRYDYSPEWSYNINWDDICNNPDLIGEYIDRVLEETHNGGFEFRTDGVVVFVYNKHIPYSNVMEHAVAFKTNSKTATTKIVKGYFSIGRTGLATPMLRVEKCDLNETMVTEINMSNLAKVKKFNLHEHDTIVIESAGDVIPMIRKVVKRGSPDPLRFDMRCPECGLRLTTIDNGETFRCTNYMCPAVVAGRISNFLEKLGCEGISDATVQSLYKQLGLKHISDFLNISEYRNEMVVLDSWGVKSVNNLLDEIAKLKQRPITHGQFIGALGIPNISTQTAKLIFENISYDEFINKLKTYQTDEATHMVFGIKGIGPSKRDTFIDFMSKHIDEIDELGSMLNIVKDKPHVDMLGNVVFTGFRSDELEEAFNKVGYEVSDNVSAKKTLAVIAASDVTKKVMDARKKLVPVVYRTDFPNDAALVSYVLKNYE